LSSADVLTLTEIERDCEIAQFFIRPGRKMRRPLFFKMTELLYDVNQIWMRLRLTN